MSSSLIEISAIPTRQEQAPQLQYTHNPSTPNQRTTPCRHPLRHRGCLATPQSSASRRLRQFSLRSSRRATQRRLPTRPFLLLSLPRHLPRSQRPLLPTKQAITRAGPRLCYRVDGSRFQIRIGIFDVLNCSIVSFLPFIGFFILAIDMTTSVLVVSCW